MSAISFRRGDTLDIPVTLNDDGLDTARLVAKASVDDVIPVIDINAVFVDKTATLHMDSVDTAAIPAGDYIYQINVIYDDGSLISFPDPSNCDGDSDFPTLQVVETLIAAGVS